MKKGLGLSFILSVGILATLGHSNAFSGLEEHSIVEASESDENTNEEASGEEETTSASELFNQVKNNEPTSERISALEDIGMHYYWHGGDIKEAEEEIFSGISLHGDYDVVEQAFRQATVLDPYDLDLKYSLASAQILQQKIPEALATYEEILAHEPDNFEAQLMHAIYSKVEEDGESYETGFKKLHEIDNERAEEYKERVNKVEDIQSVSLNTEVPQDIPEENHAFVVLGYALSDEGEMEETLLERLKVAKKAAESYPNSKIIVSGGVPKEGITEADVMHEWLIEEGIEEDRIFKEDLATDTVENGLFSMDILKAQEVKDMTLITSASHMRRALVVFDDVNHMMENTDENAGERDISHIAYMDYDTQEEAQEFGKDEEIVVYRDLIRASGIWSYPGLQR
ncbi:ElyC/SanA/YdcF family protein [Salinicoccus sp. HZC-1]|uniref:ElyC/SanA/YdcF family protein n=1 Tax=Salinicoccus sp. HZC-1 TaxID=3385497 RepID=UPI00398B6110